MKERSLLAKARMASGLTQEEFAPKIGLKSAAAVLRKERNPEEVSVRQLRQWYDAVPADGKAMLEKFVSDIFLV